MAENKQTLDSTVLKTEGVNGPLFGTKESLAFFLGKKISITNYKREPSTKEENEYFYSFQIVMAIKKDGKREAIAMRSWNNSVDVRYLFERLERGELQLPIKTRVLKEGNSFYFEGYKDYVSDKTKETMMNMGITFDEDDYNDLDENNDDEVKKK